MKENVLLKVRKPLDNPCHKLICLHHAGGGASSFYTWPQYLGDEIEVAAIQFPGREERIREELCNCRETLIEEIIIQIRKYVKGNDFSIFGHSMGGVFGYEVAKRLDYEYRLTPKQCFISASKLWNMNDILKKKVDAYNDEEFLAAISAYGGIDEELFMIEEFRKAFLEILRADFKLLEDYAQTDTLKINTPIFFMYGKGDKTLHGHQIERWKQVTSCDCIFKAFEGGHFYLNEHRKEVCQYLRKKILDNY